MNEHQWAVPPHEDRVQDQIRKIGPLETFRLLLAESDLLIRSPELDNGRLIACARSAIYTGLVREWAVEQRTTLGYDKPFAVAALGGTGRAEMSPCSDNDFAFLFDDALEGNPFLLELQRQILHSDEFRRRHGFTCLALPFSLDDVPNLAGKQLNSFLDLRPVYDPDGLAAVFRERIRSTFDPFEHFLHVRGFWKEQWEKAAGESERLDRFDIKNDGLRVFLAGVWTLAGEHFRHSHEVYGELEDARDLSAYDFLLRIRAFVHSRARPSRRAGASGNHPEDILGFEEFNSFGELLGPEANERARFEFAGEVRARLLSARRRVARFAKGIIERDLRKGRQVRPGSPMVFGVGGLQHTAVQPGQTSYERSRAALSLLLAAQHYGVPVDPAELETTFRNAGDWLIPVPELSSLFYEQRGGLAESFAFLAQLDGAEERLFPGYAKFETSLDRRVLAERTWLRGALERQKVRALEQYVREGRARPVNPGAPTPISDLGRGVSVAVEAALLDADHLAAVKLALKTKRLPVTPEDLAARLDETRPLPDRFSSGLSGIPLAEYYAPYLARCDFTPETVRITEFLIANRRAFKERGQAGPNDTRQAEEFALQCQNEQLLRALFVFTRSDRAEWESQELEPTRWFNIRELYAKAMTRFRSTPDPSGALAAAGYSPEELHILRDFGEDFFGGVYRQYANHFGVHLVRLADALESTGPKANLLRDGTSMIMGVAARDYRGLAATICGAFWHHQVDLQQAHLFSATNHHLALDFFHLAPRDKPLTTPLSKILEEAIRRQLYIGDSDEEDLPKIAGQASLREWRPGQYCLRFETSQEVHGLIYALTYKVFRHLRGDIFGLTAHAAHGAVYASVYHHLPDDLSLEEAQAIVATVF